jgi:acyl-CoA synthetase (AMP-forming)/AMP-acid ligase II
MNPMQLVPSDALGRAFGPSTAQHHLAAPAQHQPAALAAAGGDGPIEDAAGQWSRAEAAQVTDALAAAIDAALGGDGPGRLIAILLADDRRYAAAIRAAWQCGHDVVCLDRTWTEATIGEVLAGAEADLVIGDDVELRWPGGAVLTLPGVDGLRALPAPSASQRATWADHSATRRAAS